MTRIRNTAKGHGKQSCTVVVHCVCCDFVLGGHWSTSTHVGCGRPAGNPSGLSGPGGSRHPRAVARCPTPPSTPLFLSCTRASPPCAGASAHILGTVGQPGVGSLARRDAVQMLVAPRHQTSELTAAHFVHKRTAQGELRVMSHTAVVTPSDIWGVARRAFRLTHEGDQPPTPIDSSVSCGAPWIQDAGLWPRTPGQGPGCASGELRQPASVAFLVWGQ